jgi:hypothetical protein
LREIIIFLASVKITSTRIDECIVLYQFCPKLSGIAHILQYLGVLLGFQGWKQI